MLNTEFPWDRENLEVAEAVAGPAIRIEKEMVRETVSKMSKDKTAGPSGVVAEITKAAGEIVREGVILADWDLSTIVI